MLAGIAGTFLPGLPGLPLVFAGALFYSYITDFVIVTPLTLGVLFVLMLVGTVIEYLGSLAGAKGGGASKKGFWGSILGAFVGIFFLPIGILVGPLVGAILGELLNGTPLNKATRVGIGVLIGLLTSSLAKIFLGIIMLIIFIVKVL